MRLVYASSAATYGDGRVGFEDDIDALDHLAPLNLYGWTKHAFDRAVARMLREGGPRPPQWAGLKFFNAYGPNEYHKGSMISVVKVKHDDIVAGHAPRLFRSDVPGLGDGEQKRDFIWVGDIVDVLTFLLDSPGVNGLFNLGTGTARSYADLARAVCAAAGVAQTIEFVDMPEELRGTIPILHAGAHAAAAGGGLQPAVHVAGGWGVAVREGLPGHAQPLCLSWVQPGVFSPARADRTEPCSLS